MKYKKTPNYERDRQIAEELGLCHKRKPETAKPVYIHEDRLQELKKLVRQREHQIYTGEVQKRDGKEDG